MITSSPFLRIPAISTLIVAVLFANGSARTHPDRPKTEPGPPIVSAETGALNCGTWRGGGRDAMWHFSHYQAKLKDIARGRASRTPAVDFVSDDVWVVEDDGTLLISGTNLFDTQLTTFRFTPNGVGGYDVVALPLALNLGVDENLLLTDDSEAVRPLTFTFPYYGTNWTDLHIGSNGIIAFGASPNPSGFYDPDDFWNATPKLAPYFMDLDPSFGSGTRGVFFRSEGDSAVVTWINVHEFNWSSRNTFQVVLRTDGTFDYSMSAIGSQRAQNNSPIVMGIHPGGSPTVERISYSSDLPHSGAAGAAVYEDYFLLTNPLVNETALGQRFFSQFPDDFFQYVFFTNFLQTQAGFANELNISNDVTGIGLPIFDNSALYGSNGVLESRCNMNQLAAWVSSPSVRFRGTQSFLTIMGQESGHRWGAFARFRDGGGNASNLMLGRSDAHWSYFADVDHSCLEGGNWAETGPGAWVCPDLVDRFSELDEYLFGLRTAEEVTDLYYVSSASNNLTGSRSQAPPGIGATAVGVKVPVTVGDFIAQEGLRTPLPDVENKDLRQAFIFVLRAGTSASQTELDKIAGFRRAWEAYFERSCDGRLTCNTSITQTFPIGVVIGQITDTVTGFPVLNVTAHSTERNFNQHVPGGGNYTFRYLADAGSGSSEGVTLSFDAPQYVSKTISITTTYGNTLRVDVQLTPVGTPVLFTDFRARVEGMAIWLSWDVFVDEPFDGFIVYRAQPGIISALGPRLPANARSFVDETAEPGQRYQYFVSAKKSDGREVPSRKVTIGLDPLRTALHGNHPNPFNPETTISFTLAEPQRVTLIVYAADGSRVAELVNGEVRAGVTHVLWSGTDMAGLPVASGVYFYRLDAGRFSDTRKMVLLK